jgi:hypothetical protein
MKREPPVPRLDEAIGFHPSIRFVVTASKDGKILDAVKRRGVISLEPTSEMRTVIERFAIGYGLSQPAENHFGKTLTVIIRRKKLVEMLFPIADRLVIVSATPNFPLGKTAELEKLLTSLGVISWS